MPGPGQPPPRGRDGRSRPSWSPDPARSSQRARAAGFRLSSALGNHQIVAMNNLVASTVTEDAGDFTSLVTGDASNVGARIGGEAAPGFDAGAGADDHRVAALECSLDGDDTSRQQALAAP